jgi:hypothetical protein
MDLSLIGYLSGATCAAGLTVRRLILSLERRGDRKLAQYVFDQTRSTDALKGYIELRKAQQPIIVLRSKPADKEDQPKPPRPRPMRKTPP